MSVRNSYENCQIYKCDEIPLNQQLRQFSLLILLLKQ